LPPHRRIHWIGTAKLASCAVFLFARLSVAAQPEIRGISPTSGPEGTRVEISGKNLQNISAVLFGTTQAVFDSVSAERLIAIVPHKVPTSIVTVITPQGRSSSSFAFVVSNDPRIPDEVNYKAGYVNPTPPAANFGSARLWGLRLRTRGRRLTNRRRWKLPGPGCRAGSTGERLSSVTMAARCVEDSTCASLGLARTRTIPCRLLMIRHQAAVLRVGLRTDRAWHFWSPSPRAALPLGRLDGCTVRARVRISAGALLQVGMDYWRSPTIPYGTGGNNHEAGVSDWYFPSPDWQEASFTDVGGPQF
jgi:hypothetical protein